MKTIRQSVNTLNKKVDLWYENESVPTSERESWCTVGARYYGQNYELSLPIDLSKTNDILVTDITSEFHKAHEANYGFASISERIQVVNVAVKAIGDLDVPTLPKAVIAEEVKPKSFRNTLFELGSRYDTPVYERSELVAAQVIKGPAIVEQMDTTILIFPNDIGRVDGWGNLIISLAE